jgi:hypothetical protein
MYANKIAKVIDIQVKWIALPFTLMFGCGLVTATW